MLVFFSPGGNSYAYYENMITTARVAIEGVESFKGWHVGGGFGLGFWASTDFWYVERSDDAHEHSYPNMPLTVRDSVPQVSRV